MKKRRFTEEQFIGILKQTEMGMKIVEVCQQNGILQMTGKVQLHDSIRVRIFTPHES